MICLIAGNEDEAKRWAYGQLLEPEEYFYPRSETDLLFRKDFHVLVVGTAGLNIPSSRFEYLLALAKKRGRMK